MNHGQTYQQSWATIVSSKPLHEHWKSMTAMAVWFVLLSSALVVLSVTELVPISRLMGSILILAGAGLSVQAVIVKNWRGFFPVFSFGLIYAAFGAINLLYPIKGVAIATLLLIGFLVVSTIVKLILAAFLNPARGWRHITIAAMASAFLVFLLMLIDVSMPWVPAFLLAVEMMFNAWWIRTLASISRTV
ncbi:MAG: hypothetical protein PVJ72_07685 [Gammaproteobacteria bacterium]